MKTSPSLRPNNFPGTRNIDIHGRRHGWPVSREIALLSPGGPRLSLFYNSTALQNLIIQYEKDSQSKRHTRIIPRIAIMKPRHRFSREKAPPQVLLLCGLKRPRKGRARLSRIFVRVFIVYSSAVRGAGCIRARIALVRRGGRENM